MYLFDNLYFDSLLFSESASKSFPIMQIRYLFLIYAIVVLVSCRKDESMEPPQIEYMFAGDVLISEKMFIAEDEVLSIAPGSTIRFAPGASLESFAPISIVGTKSEPITLISEDNINDHWILRPWEGAGTFDLMHTYVINGLITTHDTDCHFKNVNFFNNKDLEWNSACTRFWKGEILIEDCVMDWNRKGEGFLVHGIHQPIVRNCTFKKVNDAVEFINCTDGVIRNCTFLSNSDDAIDLNDCDNILLTNNEFYGTKNRALEIGGDVGGNSINIKIINNLFVDCKIAVNVKDNSDAIVENITVIGTETALEIIHEENDGLMSNADVYNSVIVDTRWPTFTKESTLSLTNCMSEDLLPDGTNIIQTTVEFADTAMNDYRIVSSTFPTGMDATTMGYQKQ
ncbi:MAG: parallel beta-helix repeat protein [Saprospiraceae bacterium]|jgi:parallel beta-helix repeat protein